MSGKGVYAQCAVSVGGGFSGVGHQGQAFLFFLSFLYLWIELERLHSGSEPLLLLLFQPFAPVTRSDSSDVFRDSRPRAPPACGRHSHVTGARGTGSFLLIR